jgi:hypothetical protein
MNRVAKLALQTRIETILPTLNEYQRRRYLAVEAKTIGPGGISLVSQLSKVTRPTIIAGIKELNNPNQKPMSIGKAAKKAAEEKQSIKTNQHC